MKNKQFIDFLFAFGMCEKCLNIKNNRGKDNLLINIYKDQDFCMKVPSFKTDWLNRLESKIMVVG